MELEKIRKDILAGKTIEEVVEKVDWKEFEEVSKKIFEENNFKVRKNFRFKTSRRYEIDILAISSRYVFCVDCKQWGRGRNKMPGLKLAAREQENRKKDFEKFIRKNPIAKNMLEIDTKKQKSYSVIVTLFQENLIKENETFIVPIWKLNSFLIETEKYL